jgi:hypothetical protein
MNELTPPEPQDEQLNKAADEALAAYNKVLAERDALAAHLLEATRALDVGFFRLSLESVESPEDLEAMFSRGHHRAFMDRLLSQARVTIAQRNDDAYFQCFAAYYLASLFAEREEFNKAKLYADLIDFDAPPSGSNLLPYDLRVSTRLAMYHRMLQPHRRGVVLVSMPKSASAFLTQSIEEILQLPTLRAGIGEGIRTVVVTRWVKQIAERGGVTHEHFRAHPVNVQALRDAGVETVWLQVRDPRDAAFSLLRMADAERAKGRSYPNDLGETENFVQYCGLLSGWLDEWLSVDGIRVRPVGYGDVTAGLPVVLREMFGELTAEQAAHADNLSVRKGPNFRHGASRQWQATYDKDTIARASALLSDRVKELGDTLLLSPNFTLTAQRVETTND